jgi:hypothetical protein
MPAFLFAFLAILAVPPGPGDLVDPGAEYLTGTIQPLIVEDLVDPDSAKFYWPYKFFNDGDRMVTCGYFNARNRMGGFSGKTAVIVVYRRSWKPYFNIAEVAVDNDPVAGMCRQYIAHGKLVEREPEVVGQALPANTQ